MTVRSTRPYSAKPTTAPMNTSKAIAVKRLRAKLTLAQKEDRRKKQQALTGELQEVHAEYQERAIGISEKYGR
jgi:hypothetical protein